MNSGPKGIAPLQNRQTPTIDPGASFLTGWGRGTPLADQFYSQNPMAGSFSDYLENKLLDLIFGNVAYSIPATLYMAAFTAAPTDAGGGTEVSGGSYARASITNNTTNFPSASGGSKANGTVVSFPAATADWGTVVAIGLYDAASAGNLLAWATLATNKSVANGDTLQVGVGALTATLD